MRLNPKDTLFGQPILKIRAVMRDAMAGRLNNLEQGELEDRLTKILSTSKLIAKEVLKHLIDDGYLDIKKDNSSTTTNIIFKVSETEKGRRLGIASANPAISRQKADQLLNELIEKAKQVNATSAFVYYVERIKVFGSFLSDKDLLGDIDVAVKLSKRYSGDAFISQNQKRIEVAMESGRSFSNYLDRVFWPYKEVLLLLKSKKKGLSLHDEDDDDVVRIAETRTVYEFRG